MTLRGGNDESMSVVFKVCLCLDQLVLSSFARSRLVALDFGGLAICHIRPMQAPKQYVRFISFLVPSEMTTHVTQTL